MLRAMNSQKQSVFASCVFKEDAPFFCPSCTCSVTLRRGDIRIPHFAHLPSSPCPYARKDSPLIHQAKFKLFSYLESDPDCSNVEIEREVFGYRPDISLRVNNVPVIMEFIADDEELPEVQQRNALFMKKGIAMLWIRAVKSRPSSNKKYISTEVERYLHALYFGRLYFWYPDLDQHVLPIHFHTPEFGYGGTYERGTHARKGQMLLPGEIEHITNLQASFRRRTQWGEHVLPAGNLWMDQQGPWWKK